MAAQSLTPPPWGVSGAVGSGATARESPSDKLINTENGVKTSVIKRSYFKKAKLSWFDDSLQEITSRLRTGEGRRMLLS